MLGRGAVRNYLYVAIAVVLIVTAFAVTVPRTSLPDQLKTALGYHKEPSEDDKPFFNTDKWGFQADIDWLELIDFDFERLRNLPPRNYKGPGHETFATLYASRDASLRDPYFIAIQQTIFRLLWRQKSASKKYPVTVFVTQYVNQTQRDYFTAAGAIVRELGMHPFEPSMRGVPARLQDMFSKYDMWKQYDFSRILYLDGDAIPLENLDAIWEAAPERACHWDLLPEEDKVYGTDICKYVFAAAPERWDYINAGVMVLKPEQAMYQRLIRGMANTTGWDTGYLEQSLLSVLYNNEGPFPPTFLDHKWNSFPQEEKNHTEMKVLHDKMWMRAGSHDWMGEDWLSTYNEMLDFYRSEDYVQLRLKDRDAMKKIVDGDAKRLGYTVIPPRED